MSDTNHLDELVLRLEAQAVLEAEGNTNLTGLTLSGQAAQAIKRFKGALDLAEGFMGWEPRTPEANQATEFAIKVVRNALTGDKQDER
jgi:hypothetical protein